MPRGLYKRSTLQLMKMSLVSLGNTSALRHGMINSTEYVSWRGMIQRCEDENCPIYLYYGGRGIRVCDRWRHSFELFLSDVGRKPTRNLTLERIDNNKDYEPGNCRWATRKDQARNTRSNRLLTCNGETKTLAEWAERLGCCHGTIHYRLIRGWSVQSAVTTPVRCHAKK